MNSFWVPWDGQNYQKKDIIHSFVVTGYDPEQNCLFATDPYFMVKGEKLPLDLFHKGYLTASTLELVKEEVTDWKQVVSDLYGWVEKLLVDRQIFSQMRLFAEQLATSFDMRRETEGFPHFTEVPLFSELGHVADGRVKFAQMLSFLGKHVHPGFQDVSESMKKSAANWGVIRGTLIKMHLTGVVTAETLGKTVERIKTGSGCGRTVRREVFGIYFVSPGRRRREKTVWTTSAAEAVSAYVGNRPVRWRPGWLVFGNRCLARNASEPWTIFSSSAANPCKLWPVCRC